MDTFRLIDGQRVRFRDGVRVHGYITNGGQAVKHHPRARLVRVQRSRSRHRGARSESGRSSSDARRPRRCASEVKVELVARQGYRDMRNNMTMARAFGAHLGHSRAIRARDRRRASARAARTWATSPTSYRRFTRTSRSSTRTRPSATSMRFADAAASDRGFATAMHAAKALARTAVELLVDDALRASARAEWNESRAWRAGGRGAIGSVDSASAGAVIRLPSIPRSAPARHEVSLDERDLGARGETRAAEPTKVVSASTALLVATDGSTLGSCRGDKTHHSAASRSRYHERRFLDGLCCRAFVRGARRPARPAEEHAWGRSSPIAVHQHERPPRYRRSSPGASSPRAGTATDGPRPAPTRCARLLRAPVRIRARSARTDRPPWM